MIATVALGFGYFHRPANDAPSLRSSILPPENTSFVGGVAASGYAFSPDGTRLVFSVQSVEGKSGLWMRPLNSLTAQELAGTENGTLPFWSPDGQWVGFFADGKLKKTPASGGSVQVICDAPVGRGGTWNAQGSNRVCAYDWRPSVSGLGEWGSSHARDTTGPFDWRNHASLA